MSGLRLAATQRELRRGSVVSRWPNATSSATASTRCTPTGSTTRTPTGLILGYVPDARLGFATDIWSPGAGPLPDKLNPALAALVAGVKKAGIEPTRFADYAPLAALKGK